MGAVVSVAGDVIEFENAVDSVVFVGAGDAQTDVGVGGEGCAEEGVDAEIAGAGVKLLVCEQEGSDAESSGVEMMSNAAGGENHVELGGDVDDIGVDELIEIVLATRSNW